MNNTGEKSIKRKRAFGKIRHKSAAVIAALTLCCITAQTATAYSPEDEMLNFGIIAQRTDINQTVTFAEYGMMMIRAAGFEGMLSAETGDKWYSSAMKTAEGLGYFDAFLTEVDAEKPIKTEYALAMTCAALGYGASIEPTLKAWYTKALQLGLAQGLTVKEGDELTRQEAYIIIHNALDTNICVINGVNFYISDDTLEDRLLDLRDSEYLLGTVEATDTASISANTASKGKVMISGELFEAGESGAENYLGSYIRFLAQENRDGSRTIKWIEPHKNNDILFIDENTDKDVSNGMLYYYDENGRSKHIRLSDGLITVYNNRVTPRTLEDVLSDDSRVKLTDNNGDGRYDIAEITKLESYVVKKVYKNPKQIVFEYASDGKKRLDIDDKIEYDFFDTENNPIDIEDIKEGDALSVIVDEKEEYFRIYKTAASFEGKASSKDKEEITVNAQVYKIYGEISDVSVGRKYDFYTDLWNRVFYAQSDFDDYVYIREAYTGDNPDSVYIDTFDGTEFNVYSVSLKATVDGAKKSTAKELINAIKTKTLASITLSAENEVRKIETAKEYAQRGYRTYCENDFGFVDYENKILKPFACDKNKSKIFFIPTTDDKDDYLNIFELDDDEDYMVTGFDYDEKINRARAAIVEIDPEKPLQSGFGDSSGIMAVNEISTKLAENDEITYQVTGICGGDEISITAAQRQNVFNVLADVQKGDVIQFVKNINGDIGLVRKVMDYSELDGGYYYDDSDYKNIKLYAPAFEVNEDVMTNARKYLVNEIRCRVNGIEISSSVSASEEKIPSTSNKGFNNYFVYDNKQYVKGTIDSIVCGDGSNGSALYIWSQNDDVKFIAVINK